MLRNFSLFAVAAVFLLVPVQLIAGGPPRLCLPIDGVTPDKVEACANLLTAKLENKIWLDSGRQRGIQIQQHKNQWYLMLPMREQIGLRDIEAALKGSAFSVPRERLRVFGHVILEIDAGPTPPKKLLADLEAVNYVSVAESEVKADRLLVTVDMPYPVENGGRDRESVGWETFQRNNFSSDQTTKSESPATSRMLPSYDAFRDIVAKHNANLKDIRWNTNHACRVLGCVTVPEPNAVTSAKRT